MALSSGGPKGQPLFSCLERLTLRGKTAEDRKLLEMLEPVAVAAGYDIVRLRMVGGDRARRMQIMAERPDGTMLVEDCAALSRACAIAASACARSAAMRSSALIPRPS